MPMMSDTATGGNATATFSTSIIGHQDAEPGKSFTEQAMKSCVPSDTWPPEVCYLPLPVLSPFLGEGQIKWLRTRPKSIEPNFASSTPNAALPVISLPLTRTEIDGQVRVALIEDVEHPAYGQRGLFAARDLAPGQCIIPYLGYVHSSTSSENETQQVSGNEPTDTLSQRLAAPHSFSRSLQDIGHWDTSSYDLNMCREHGIELAVDAFLAGNEARFCNDYRGVPADRYVREMFGASRKLSYSGPSMAIPNAEFRDVWFDLSQLQLEESADRPAKTNCKDASAATGPHRDESSKDGEREAIKMHSGRDKGAASFKAAGAKAKQERRNARRNKLGVRGVAIFVLPAGNSGKRKHGIRAGQEILVSYGKGFWAHRQ